MQKVTGIYLHKVPYIDNFFVTVQVLVKYITLESVRVDVIDVIVHVKMSFRF